MPRSGTTLAEQVLDSHPNVAGLGERVELLQTTHKLQTRLAWSKLRYPECIRFLNADIVRAVADEMLEDLTGSAPDARYVVTKRPNDFWELGLIKILFPNCKIIHCCRHPADTCLSCFMQDFSDVPFASRLEHLASYYAQYERMMAHWATVLDATQMFTLRYESLVRNFRPVTESLLDFCGLAYDDDCEAFFKNNRSVETASVWQVREPIYARSVERWLNYARFLGPLRRFINDPAASSWLDHDGARRRASEPSAGRTFSVESCETVDADLGELERFSANSEPPRLTEAEHVEFAG